MAKNCVIIGVGPGNGAAFARRFASAGYQVAMLSRDESYLEQLSAEILGSRAIPCDARDPDSIRGAFDRIHEALGAVDVMIYNAGAGDWRTFII